VIVGVGLRFNNLDGKLSVGCAAVGGGDHEDNFLFIINFIEKAPGGNSITPGVGVEAP